MRNLALTWQQAALLAVGLGVVALVLSVLAGTIGPSNQRLRAAVPNQRLRAAVPNQRLRAAVPFARESAIIAALYSLWQFAGSFSVVGPSGAFARGRWIMRFERTLRLPSERDLQRLIVHHRTLAQACNLYYATMHFAGLGLLLVWLFGWHRSEYTRVRTTIVLLTAACLVIQFVPIAPPRLFPQDGFVDVAERYGQSVYAAFPTADQLSAMPSVHVGWAVLVGWAVVTIGHSRWRWLVLLHPAITIFVVIATGNHFWLDGIVAVLLLVLAESSRRAGAALWRTYRSVPVRGDLIAA
jgi:hypothetical protein